MLFWVKCRLDGSFDKLKAIKKKILDFMSGRNLLIGGICVAKTMLEYLTKDRFSVRERVR